MKLVWRKRAEAAYLAQISHVKQRNADAAARLQTIVEYRLDLLTRHPEMARPGRRPGTRELVFSDTPYIAIYRLDGGTITILQFFHASQTR